ncbi:MAG: ABC transporter substrate-binding protein [Verrucomicrobiota bacterium]|nr:ABC transporter substrate-binding protein [Verrucomicrobiota bacterium]
MTRWPRIPVAKFLLSSLLAFVFGECFSLHAFTLARPDPETRSDRVLLGSTKRLRSLDPIGSGDIASAMITGLIYEGLLRYGYLDRPYRLEPQLAEAMPEVDATGTRMTFRLRPGIYFADDRCFPSGSGREVTAADFRYSILRLADPRSSTTGFWVIRGRLRGLEAFRKRVEEVGDRAYEEPVEGIQALDDYTLEFLLTEPYPQFLWVLTMHYLHVVPREAVEFYGGDFQRHPVGTGPYRLVEWKRNYRIELERNPKWAQTGRREVYPEEGQSDDVRAGLLADAGASLPFADRIIRYVVQDESTAWLMFLAGGLDLTLPTTDQFEGVSVMGGLSSALEARGVVLDKVPALQTIYIGFGMDDPVVGGNKKLRQALSSALDRSKLIELRAGQEIEAVNPIPPGIPGNTTRPNPYGYDLDRARRLLAEAGYPEGISERTGSRLELTLDFASQGQPEMRQRADLMVGMMRSIGVRLTPRFQLEPTFFERIDRRESQMFYILWSADYPDGENFLQLFFGPNSSPGPNHTNYASDAFDRLFEQARRMPDGAERTELYERLAGMVQEDCPWILVTHPLIYQLRHGWLENYKPHDFPYGNEVYYKVEPARRERMRKAFRKQPLGLRPSTLSVNGGE